MGKLTDAPPPPMAQQGKKSACNVGDMSLIPGLERSPGGGNRNLLQYSCLKNLLDRGAWWLQSGGSQRVEHDWVTQQLSTQNDIHGA